MKYRYTSETLRQEQARLRQQIRQSGRRIANHWEYLTTPPVTEGRFQNVVAQAERAFVVYDGVMTGYKLFKRFNRFAALFTKKKKQTRR